jgi:hypothetical protein
MIAAKKYDVIFDTMSFVYVLSSLVLAVHLTTDLDLLSAVMLIRTVKSL